MNPQNSYAGPSGTDDADACKCNTVAYNLVSACDACQGEPWTTCVDSSDSLGPKFRNTLPCTQLFCLVGQLHLQCDCWNVNCTSSPPATELNQSPSLYEPIPLGTRVPNWAYINSATVSFPCNLLFSLNLFPFPPQSGSWNATTAQLAGGAHLCQRTTHFMYFRLGHRFARGYRQRFCWPKLDQQQPIHYYIQDILAVVLQGSR